MNKETNYLFVLLSSFLLLAGCSYNPFIPNNHLTGSPVATAVGAGAAAGSVALLDGPRPLIPIMGIGGGMLGYYLSTLRHDSAGILRAGGEVYKVGDYVGIYVPSDQMFEPNTDEFLPRAGPILDSIAEVLERYPANNIMISGSTSGFFRARWEQNLSERRARRISAYLWNVGISEFKLPGTNTRKLSYVGYGNYFPISHSLTNLGIRKNSRIQIVSYPGDCTLRSNAKTVAFENPGSMTYQELESQFCTGCG